MAKESGSALGSILGVVIGAILIAGIAGTPFYISMFQNENRGLDIAVNDDVEGLRRVVQHLDQHLATMADANELAPDEALTPEDARGLELPKSSLAATSVEQTYKLLTKVNAADQQRDTKIAKPLPSPNANASEAVSAVTKRFHSENKELQAKAQKAISAISQARVGTAGANASLNATRAQAIYWTTAAKINANRADLEEDLASLLLRKSMWSVDVISTLQLDIDAVNAQMPTAALAALREEASKIKQEIDQIEANADTLRSQAGELSEQLASAEKEATEIAGKMAELKSIGIEDSIDRSDRYHQLTLNANEIASRIATLRNGAAAEGIENATGLRDIERRIKQAEESLVGWQKALSHFEEQIEALTENEQNLADIRSDLDGKKSDLASTVEEMLASAEEHQANAQKAREEAIKNLEKARTLATTGASLAGRRASAVPDSEPDLKDMIRKDGDTRASLLCLSAEVDFAEALLLTNRIQTLRDTYALRSNIANTINIEAPEDPAATIEELHAAAAEKLANANKRYEEAASSLKASSTKGAGGTFSGANYVWQTNIGLASVELLRATLNTAATGTVDTEAQDKAYDLLVDAVKDREQSPLLTPAIDVIKYLQRRVAE